MYCSCFCDRTKIIKNVKYKIFWFKIFQSWHMSCIFFLTIYRGSYPRHNRLPTQLTTLSTKFTTPSTKLTKLSTQLTKLSTQLATLPTQLSIWNFIINNFRASSGDQCASDDGSINAPARADTRDPAHGHTHVPAGHDPRWNGLPSPGVRFTASSNATVYVDGIWPR